MKRKQIILNMFLMLPPLLSTGQAQYLNFELLRVEPKISTEYFNEYNGDIFNSPSISENRIDFKQEVYWPLGVDSPLYQVDESMITVYSYIDKPKLDNLSGNEIQTVKNGIADVLELPASRNQLNYRDNLAPSIQITF